MNERSFSNFKACIVPYEILKPDEQIKTFKAYVRRTSNEASPGNMN